MKIINWEEVEESRPSTMLEPGGYVCRITDVEDVPSREYLWIMYDVIEGERAGVYAGLPKSDDWKHRFTRSYKDTARGMFKAFVNRVEESNRGFKWDGRDERQFVGKEIGLVFQKEQYTKNNGEDGERTVVVGVEAAQDIRNGDYRLPEPQDRRSGAGSHAKQEPTAGPYDDLPFK